MVAMHAETHRFVDQNTPRHPHHIMHQRTLSHTNFRLLRVTLALLVRVQYHREAKQEVTCYEPIDILLHLKYLVHIL